MRLLAKVALLAAIVGGCVGCDQVAKAVARQRLANRPPVVLLGGTLLLVYAENEGAFLSLGSRLPAPARRLIFTVGVALALLGTAAYVLADKAATPAQVAAVGLLLGGGVGNLIDRLAYGIVRDFLYLGIGPVRTGIFNLADVAITAAAVLLGWSLFSLRGRKTAA